MMKKLTKRLVFFGIIMLLFVGAFWGQIIFASEEPEEQLGDLQNQIEELEGKLKENRAQQNTLASQISYMNQRIELAQLRISQTTAEINKLEEEIADLGVKIGKLDVSLDKISRVLLHRVVETYKANKSDNVLALFSADGLEEIARNSQYLGQAQKHDKMLMVAVEEAKQNFDNQKELKEEKQAKLGDLKQQLEEQNKILAQQKTEKQNLLTVTQNDEARYQRLLKEARQELASLLSFSRHRSGYQGTCAGEFSGGETGWYFSQRDSRWCNVLIGDSDMTIGQVGCLISSVAMVNKSRGVDVNPTQIASNSSFFFLKTAYMNFPFPSFIGQSFQEISKQNIDNELSNNNPVVAHLTLSGDGHWIVLFKKEHGGYIINDPWYGPDINLDEYYDWGLIGRAYVLR